MNQPRPAVCLDIQATQSRAHADRGIARYVAEQAAALTRVAPDVAVEFLLNPRFMLPPNLDPLVLTGRVRWGTLDSAPRGSIHHVASPFEMDLPVVEVWGTGNSVRRRPLVVTLYDTIPLVFQDRYLSDPATRVRYRARTSLVRCADRVLAISESTRKDAIERLGVSEDRVRVIGAGVSEIFRPSRRAPEEIAASLRDLLPGLRPGFFFYTGGVDFRKNMEGLVHAYAGLPADVRAAHQLVITCRMRPEEESSLMALAERLGASNELLLTGFVSDATLRSLYQATHLFVFPSLYEGFGLPVAEAIRCGAPVIAADTSSLPEIVQDDSARFDPEDPEVLRGLLLRAASDPSFISRLRGRSRDGADRFLWDDVGRATAAVYRELMDEPSRRPHLPRPSRRPRLSLLTPFPPQTSGVASYSASLISALVQKCDVDCFVLGAPSAYIPPSDSRCRLHSADRFESRARFFGYDATLYCLGNSEFHDFIFRLLERHSGDVLAHEVRYTGYYSWRAATEGANLVDTLSRMYGARLPEGPYAQGYLSQEEAQRLGIWMLIDVLRNCHRLFVHSGLAQEIARLEASAAGLGTPVLRVPFGFPEPGLSRPKKPGRRPLLVSFGLVDPVKRSHVLVQALAEIRRRHPSAALLFAGPVAPSEVRRLRDLATEFHVGDAVACTGELSRERYHDLLGRADMAIQLRAVAQGEASASVAEAMANGLPTIVSRRGWMSELPDDVVLATDPECGPAELASVVSDLLDDEERFAGFAMRGQEYARAHSFDVAADGLLSHLL